MLFFEWECYFLSFLLPELDDLPVILLVLLAWGEQILKIVNELSSISIKPGVGGCSMPLQLILTLEQEGDAISIAVALVVCFKAF